MRYFIVLSLTVVHGESGYSLQYEKNYIYSKSVALFLCRLSSNTDAFVVSYMYMLSECHH